MSAAAPLHVAGTRVLLDPAGALFLPERQVLAVADLHLEKGSAAAARGQLVPPWDTSTTLDRLSVLLRRYRPQVLVALGDSFHDAAGSSRMLPGDQERLARLAAGQRTIWVLGNHDPAPPAGLRGDSVCAYQEGSLLFCHIGGQAPAGEVEICGHHHPKAAVPARAGTLTRPCFVTDATRVMLPAFGAYTGGLDIRDHAIGRLFPRGGRAFLLGQQRLFSFGFSRPMAAAAR